MSDQSTVIEGKVSSKLQLTIPARVRDALGIEPGDTVRYELEGGSVRLNVVRPDVRAVLEEIWNKHDMSAFNDEVGVDAVAHVRSQRGWDDHDDQR